MEALSSFAGEANSSGPSSSPPKYESVTPLSSTTFTEVSGFCSASTSGGLAVDPNKSSPPSFGPPEKYESNPEEGDGFSGSFADSASLGDTFSTNFTASCKGFGAASGVGLGVTSVAFGSSLFFSSAWGEGDVGAGPSNDEKKSPAGPEAEVGEK